MKKNNFKNRKVLITGGAGFVGSNLAQRLVKHGAEITILDNFSKDSGANLENLESVTDKIVIIRGDVRNKKDIAKAVVGSEFIFHCAAHSSHPGSMLNPLKDMDTNVFGMLALLEEVTKTNPKTKIIFTATSTQIGEMKLKEINELHPEFPRDIYSAHKSLAEKYLLIYSKAYGLNSTSLRLPNIYGPRANISSSDFGFVNYFIGMALQNSTLSIYGSGSQIRSLIFIEDIIDALLLAAFDNNSGEVYFISSDDFFSVYDIAKKITQVIGGNIKKVSWPEDRKRIEVGDNKIDDSKFRKKFGWIPKFSLKSGLSITKKFYLHRLDRYLKK